MTGWPAHWAGDVVLADGGTAHVRPITPQDAKALVALHGRLSPESIYLRFFSPHPRLSPAEIEHFTNVDHDARVALGVLLGDKLIAVGRYDRLGRSGTAEVAFVVEDAQQGRGIATVLLERLAAAARERGLQCFTADVLPHNRAMLAVFHDAGFEVKSRFEDGVVRVSFPVDGGPGASALSAKRERQAQARSVARLLAPRGIGLIAEGREADALVDALCERLLDSGFPGPVRRLSAFAPAGDTHGLDLVLVAVPPELLEAQLERCAEWAVHGAVLLAVGEPGDAALEARSDRALAERARRAGLRLLGPASLGLARLTDGLRLEAVATAVPLVPGGLALFTERAARGRRTLEAASARGLGLSSFLSAGRKADVSASDALDFWEEDAATRVIALALRSLGNPRRSAAILRRVARKKPVVVWLADLPATPPEEFVQALAGHTGAIGCDSLDDFLDVAAALLDGEGGRREAHVEARIAAWEAWRRQPAGRSARAEGVDPRAARRLVDQILGATPAGAELSAGDVAALLGSYGVTLEEPPRPDAGLRGRDIIRVRQEPAWGSLLARDDAQGRSTARLVPLSDRDLRALAAAGPRGLREQRQDLLRRIATLAADLPELASLSLALPRHEGEAPALVPGSSRLAPWTLGLASPTRGA